MREEDCLGARFEILVDGKTQYCRDTLVTAMGAANIIRGQNPKSRVAAGTCRPASSPYCQRRHNSEAPWPHPLQCRPQ
jgi:hypothetical protein